MSKEERCKPIFRWEVPCKIAAERPNLGQTTAVAVYRLMHFTLRDLLIKEYGGASADRIFFEAGAIPGKHFYKNLKTKRQKFSDFISELQETTYDEGLIAELPFARTHQEFGVKEVDCWCSGDRVCRFEAKPA